MSSSPAHSFSLPPRSKPYRRIKLMTVGAANKGKTSLLLNLTKKGRVTRFKEVEFGYNNRPLSTVGVDLGDWEYAPGKKPKVTFMTWDFGGQVCSIPFSHSRTVCLTSFPFPNPVCGCCPQVHSKL